MTWKMKPPFDRWWYRCCLYQHCCSWTVLVQIIM